MVIVVRSGIGGSSSNPIYILLYVNALWKGIVGVYIVFLGLISIL